MVFAYSKSRHVPSDLDRHVGFQNQQKHFESEKRACFGVRMMRRLWILIPLLFWALPLSAQVIGNESLIRLDQGQLSYLSDPEQNLDLTEARQAEAEGLFHPLKSNLGLGFISRQVWVHFRIDRAPDQPADWWLDVIPPFLDSIEFFHLTPSGTVDRRQGGDMMPQSAHEEPHRGTTFKLSLEPGEHQFFVRIQTASSMLAAFDLWQPDAFKRQQLQSNFLISLYFSLIVVVMLSNLLAWLMHGQAIYLIYSAYLLLSAVSRLAFTGLASQFLFPEAPWLANLTGNISFPLSVALGYAIFNHLFELRRYHPFLHRWLKGAMVLTITTAIAAALGHYPEWAPWMLGTSVLTVGALIGPALRVLTRRRLFDLLIAAVFILFLFQANGVLVLLGVLPFRNADTHAIMFVNVSIVLLIHLALMARYKQLERAHARAVEG